MLTALLKETNKNQNYISPTLNGSDYGCLHAKMKTNETEFISTLQNDKNMAEILVGFRQENQSIFEGLVKVLFDAKNNQIKIIVYHQGKMQEKTIYDGNAQSFTQKI